MSDCLGVYVFDMPAVVKKRPRIGKHGAYTPKITRDFENSVAQLAKLRMMQENYKITDEPLGVIIEFDLAANRGDLDNYVKSVLDALEGIVYTNDRLIQWQVVHKCKVKDKPQIRVAVFKYSVWEKIYQFLKTLVQNILS